MLCIGRWMSERYLRSISQAQRRMKSVLCYAKPSPIARNTVFPPFLSVSCQGWVVMLLRCLPQSKNSLTVASTSISRRRSLTCLGMTTNHPCLPCHVSNALHLCTVGAREHHLPFAVRKETIYRQKWQSWNPQTRRVICLEDEIIFISLRLERGILLSCFSLLTIYTFNWMQKNQETAFY